jgi:hypothetical protein
MRGEFAEITKTTPSCTSTLFCMSGTVRRRTVRGPVQVMSRVTVFVVLRCCTHESSGSSAHGVYVCIAAAQCNKSHAEANSNSGSDSNESE